MNTQRIFALLGLIVFALAAGSSSPASQRALIVPRYGIFEQTFNWSSSKYSNPWEQVQVTMTLISPTGKTVSIKGFYYGPDTWKARFSPAETGAWSWQVIITDGLQSARFDGTFTTVDSDSPGFVRQNPNNPFRWVFDDGSPYHPIGIEDCFNDDDKSGTPFDNMGFDGDFRLQGTHDPGRVTDLSTYLKAYSDAGVNLFRWSVDNCAFKLWETIAPEGNRYLVRESQWGDELVQKLRQYGFRIYMTFFGFNPPFPNGSGNPAQMDAVKRYVQYVVDRYGAYVDFWELMNEFPNPPATIDDAWYTQVAAYLRSVDPYKHPISTSWQRPDLAVIEITSPHWYQKENEFESDLATVDQIRHWKSFNKPVIFGEQGNSEQNWDIRSALRMRIRSWTAFFDEAVLIFWNSSFAKDYRGGVASNIYLGPEERGYLKVLQDFTRGFDSRALRAEVQVSNPALVRGYALQGPTAYAAYLHAYIDHTNPTSGISMAIEPVASGTAIWISPASGEVLGTQSVSAGSQMLAVPSFITDIALKITAATSSAASPTADWVVADAHLHGHGCGGQRGPAELLALLSPASLNIASALVWGQGFADDRPYFTGQDAPGSSPARIVHYDLEVSAFPSDLMGHQVVLGLSSIEFPDKLSSLPIADWAHTQGAIDGFAHAGTWPADGAFPVAGQGGNVPFEAPVRAALGTLDFIEIEQLMTHDGRWSNGITQLWYPLLNSGIAVPIVGGSDYPCLPEGAGAVRTLFPANIGTGYDGWLKAIRNGRTVVAGNRPGSLDMTINGQPLGSVLDIRSGQSLDVAVTANLPEAGRMELIVNGRVEESADVGAGANSKNFTVVLTQSAWIAVRAPGFHTSPIYVRIDGRPIRASASDADYFARYIDDLLRQIDAGAFARHDIAPDQMRSEFAAVRNQYLTARDEFRRRVAETVMAHRP